MSTNNGVIRVGRKGRKKFAFGEDGEPFEVDVVVAFQEWIGIDDQFRERSEDRSISVADMPAYHQAAVAFVLILAGMDAREGAKPEISTAEALDFIARLREQYDEVAAFFQPRSLVEQDLPASSGAELRFSVEGAN